ncbi:relaxase/mobilization nuclease domain-containing protein [Zobellia sp. 1_MG-2023]|uniref:relaxase/mobilization nuclease domain-containing protein n=1 Tax=Zobellia sp. 1_MG-2023 TaxID=3062626 RepID=UPI0026E2FF46|nr:relaxase/mobilization nuclease domain-containing protein [Zobellia sp. 1_MG-2023]MDO6818932.1 relaxase/mobilization nuclease domain-containing protein [Zobellia sp. 1_MG-2023]
MIGKGKSISHTSASMAYGWNQEKSAIVVLKEYLAGNTPEELTKEFQIIQDMNENCKKNTLSFVLSPTIEDGKKLKKKNLGDIAKKFLARMNLNNRQAVAFVHKDKAHTHIHLYVNRIDFKGKAYPDGFIGKRSIEAARQVALEMNLKTAQEIQVEKLNSLKQIRREIHNLNEHVLRKNSPKTLDDYIKKMKLRGIDVIPSINKSNKLQGFRFKYKNISLKGSEIHRSMSGGKITNAIAGNGHILQNGSKTTLISNKVVELGANFIANTKQQSNQQLTNKGLSI